MLNRQAARALAGLTGRGRTPNSAIEAYLRSNPAEARAFAREVGVAVPARGRIPDATIAVLVSKA
jgi:hypothetical protein